MHIVVFSDFHAHLWTEGSRPVEWQGMQVNSRLLDQLRALDQIEHYCLEHDIKHVMFCGDLFHERQRVHTVVFNFIFKRLFAMYKKDISIYLLSGNHDQAGTNVGAEHSMKPFGIFARIFDTNSAFDVGGFRTYHCPYYQKETDAALQMRKLCAEDRPDPSCDILLMHQGLSGARISATDFLLQDLKVEDLPEAEFMHTFLGHYHMPQNMTPDVEYVGATLQHSWSDAGQTNRGFIDYDVSSGVTKRIPIKAPGFYDLKQADMDTFDFLEHLKDFIRIEVGTSFDLAAQHDFLKQYPDDVNIKFIPAPIEADESSGVSLSLSMSKVETLEAYVDSGVQSIDDLSAETIKTAGKYLVSGERWPASYGRQEVSHEAD